MVTFAAASRADNTLRAYAPIGASWGLLAAAVPCLFVAARGWKRERRRIRARFELELWTRRASQAAGSSTRLNRAQRLHCRRLISAVQETASQYRSRPLRRLTGIVASRLRFGRFTQQAFSEVGHCSFVSSRSSSRRGSDSSARSCSRPSTVAACERPDRRRRPGDGRRPWLAYRGPRSKKSCRHRTWAAPDGYRQSTMQLIFRAGWDGDRPVTTRRRKHP